MRWHRDELWVVGVGDSGSPAIPWRPLQLIFREQGQPEEVIVPERIAYDESGAEIVVGHCWSQHEFERATADGEVIQLEPRRVGAGKELVRTGDKQYSVVARGALTRLRNQALTERLAHALELAESGVFYEDVADAFASAREVDPSHLVPAILACGWAVKGGDSEAAEMAADDLLEQVSDPADLRRVRALSLWTSLRSPHIRAALLAQARAYLEEVVAPDAFLGEYISTQTQLRAAVLGCLRQEWRGRPESRIAHELVANALSGDPGALDKVNDQLSGVPEWASWMALINHSPDGARAKLLGDYARAEQSLGRAQEKDLIRLARTWRTLEENNYETDRMAIWRSRRLSFISGLGSGAAWREGERLAENVRSTSGMNGHAIESVTSLLAGVGIRVDSAVLPENHVVGVLPRRVPPCVFLNPSRDKLAVRFAAAHEMAHLLVDGNRGREFWNCTTESEQGPGGHEERRANAFAVYLMAPRQAVRAVVGTMPTVGSAAFVEAALRLRHHFGLSPVTAAEHMVNCLGPSEVREPLSFHIRQTLFLADQSVTSFEQAESIPKVDSGTGRSVAFRQLLQQCVESGAVSKESADAVLPALEETA